MILCVAVVIAAGIAGYRSGTLPVGAGWRFFSWHPFLMMASIGFSTVAALIKKQGGYANTVMHGNLSFVSVALMATGYWVIYSNKEAMNKPHITTSHAQNGVGTCQHAPYKYLQMLTCWPCFC